MDDSQMVVINGVTYAPVYQMVSDDDDHPYVLVRCDRASVFVGYLQHQSGQHVTLSHARRIWHWKGAATLSELATKGTSLPDQCKFPAPVPLIELLDAVEIIPVSVDAQESINRVPVWSAHD